MLFHYFHCKENIILTKLGGEESDFTKAHGVES